MHINNIGYHHVHDADFLIDRPTGSGDYLFLLIKSSAHFVLHGQEVIAQPNSFILFRKGTAQVYKAIDSTFDNDWFHLDLTPKDLSFLDSLKIPFDTLITLDDIHPLSNIIKHMCYENYSTNQYKEESVQYYLKLFFYKLSEQQNRNEDHHVASYYDKMSLIRMKIYNMPYHKWTIEGMAHELTLSPSYFQHLYKQIFGVSAIHDVIQSRIDHAKYLLTSTDFTIKIIAEKCGYDNDIHFMRQFKNETGMTPSTYRKM